ncbi:MAG: efflux RND transporter periplasmic adaptor subunit [Rhizomicrobium sp.]
MKAILKPVLPALLIVLSCISAHATPAYLSALGTVRATTVTVTSRLDGQLISVNFKEGQLIQEGQLLAKIDEPLYRLQLQEAQSRVAWDQTQLDAATARQDTPPVQIAQLKDILQIDRAKVELAQRQLSYADITAPITGVAGFRLVDVGNFVHSGEGLVVINQPQPIAVVFSVPQEVLPTILERIRTGESPVVELWNRQGTEKIATGRMDAVDNQIDPTTGTVKLKATCKNKDGALFPNAFVNVRLFLNAQ